MWCVPGVEVWCSVVYVYQCGCRTYRNAHTNLNVHAGEPNSHDSIKRTWPELWCTHDLTQEWCRNIYVHTHHSWTYVYMTVCICMCVCICVGKAVDTMTCMYVCMLSDWRVHDWFKVEVTDWLTDWLIDWFKRKEWMLYKSYYILTVISTRVEGQLTNCIEWQLQVLQPLLITQPVQYI